MNASIAKQKPKRLWEWREYEKGSLVENGVALNESGTLIWKLCDGNTTVADIVDAVTKVYDVEKETAERDVISLIRLLAKENALKVDE